VSIAFVFQLDHPHAHIWVWFIAQNKLMDKSTQICSVTILEGKQEQKMAYYQTCHPIEFGVHLNKTSIISRELTMPVYACLN
jgi:hypothetical protein